jgi:hypothetical protein
MNVMKYLANNFFKEAQNQTILIQLNNQQQATDGPHLIDLLDLLDVVVVLVVLTVLVLLNTDGSLIINESVIN